MGRAWAQAAAGAVAKVAAAVAVQVAMVMAAAAAAERAAAVSTGSGVEGTAVGAAAAEGVKGGGGGRGGHRFLGGLGGEGRLLSQRKWSSSPGFSPTALTRSKMTPVLGSSWPNCSSSLSGAMDTAVVPGAR